MAAADTHMIFSREMQWISLRSVDDGLLNLLSFSQLSTSHQTTDCAALPGVSIDGSSSDLTPCRFSLRVA